MFDKRLFAFVIRLAVLLDECIDDFTFFFKGISRVLRVERDIGLVDKLIVELDCVLAHYERENAVDIVCVCKHLDVSRRDLQAVCKRSDVAENGVVFDEREGNSAVFVFVGVTRRIVRRRHCFARSERKDTADKFADFVCVDTQGRNVEVTEVNEQAAVYALVVALFVLVAITRIVGISRSRKRIRCYVVVFARRFVEIVTAVLGFEVVVVSLARVDIFFARYAGLFFFREQLERAANHINAEHIVVVGIVAALGLKSYAEVDVTCNVRNEVGQLRRIDVCNNLLKQLDDGEQIHIAVELVALVGVLDKFGTHKVEQCRNLNVNVQNELQGTIHVTAVVRLRLDDEKLLVRKAREERLKHRTQIDVVVRAALELRRNVDGFAEREAVNVVHIGVLCKFVAAEDVRTRVGERNVEILDRKFERERHIVLAAVVDVGLVCNRARNVLVNRNRAFIVFEHRIWGLVEQFAAVALAVVENSDEIRLFYAFIGLDFVLGIAIFCGNFVFFFRRNCTDVVAVFALDVVAVCVLLEYVVDFGIVDLFCKAFLVRVRSCIVGIFVVSVAVETECDVNGKVDAVGRVEFDLQSAVDFLIEQVFDVESEQIFGDVFEDCVKEFVAEFQGEQVFVDEHRKSKFFVAEVNVACLCAACHKRFARGCRLLVARNEVFVVGIEVDDVVFEDFRDVETADCELLNVERFFEIDVDCVVDVVRAEPQTLVTRFGDVDKFEFEFGLGEVVDVNHKRHVESEVCGRITLRG